MSTWGIFWTGLFGYWAIHSTLVAVLRYRLILRLRASGLPVPEATKVAEIVGGRWDGAPKS